MEITKEIVIRLIKEQFPKWGNLTISPVEKSGHDNRTFHLGDSMLIRLPSDKCYEPAVQKESTWLPYLSKHISYQITKPIAIGKPSTEYPYTWSINEWIDGETLSESYCNNSDFVKELTDCLKQLQSIDTNGGPVAGLHNFYRGGDLCVYDDETRKALNDLNDKIDTDICTYIWERALSSKWNRAPVWVHGDVAEGNILVKDNTLVGLIDFGVLAIGDPACDLVIAWTFFDEKCRKQFIKAMDLDINTWYRAMGWALWKALITYDNQISKKVIDILIKEYTL
ncbi:MAG: aminoglycoside phosphotransferase family protein [Coprobacillaceae bacterium]